MRDSYEGPANGVGRTMYFTILNEGNDDESYRLELVSNFLLGATLRQMKLLSWMHGMAKQ